MSLLEVKKVTMNFGGVVALKDVDFGVSEGEILALIGPNGAGKTTLFNCVTGFSKPTSGSICLRGADITGIDPYLIARSGVVRTFQKTMIFPRITVEEAVMVGAHLNTRLRFMGAIVGSRAFREDERRLKADVGGILEFVGLSRRRKELGMNLPYGEQRLLEVAIAMAAKPTLLLLDEPAAGLNAEESGRLMGLIRKIRSTGVTVLLVEHNMNVVMKLSDRVVVLNQGKKIAEGRPEEVRNNPDVVRAYLGGVRHA